MSKTAILLIDCPDRKGLVAAIANFLVQEYDANVLNADQHQDVELGLFFMRVEFTTEKTDCDADQFARAFGPLAELLRLHWQLHFVETAENVAIFVSQYLHCLADLLFRHRNGEFRSQISNIVSNHENARALAEFYEVPFLCLPTNAGIREQVEERQLQLLEENNVDLVVLARYMQVLSPNFVARYPQRIINVHHSFLPAFTDGFGGGQSGAGSDVINIATNCSERSDGSQCIQNGIVTDIAGVKNMVAADQSLDRFWAQQAVSIGDNANASGTHVSSLRRRRRLRGCADQADRADCRR